MSQTIISANVIGPRSIMFPAEKGKSGKCVLCGLPIKSEYRRGEFRYYEYVSLICLSCVRVLGWGD